VEIYRSFDEIPSSLRGGAVTVGNFDGVHRGHARIIERLVAQAALLGGPAVVLTFDPHPVQILRPQNAPHPLTWTSRKAELLAELGVDAVIAYPTDEAFLGLGPREFFDRIVRDGLGARAMVEGPNFFFGKNRSGDIHLLERLCAEASMALQIVQPVVIDDQIVSSSRVRTLVAEGRIEIVSRLLTRPYRIRGQVVHGAGRGAKLGFPTANLEDIATLLPAEGIYAGRALADGNWWPGAISLGPNPTFEEGGLKVEVHLIEFHGDLYDQWIEVDFLARLRDIKKFASVEPLLAQMDRDLAATRTIAEAAGPASPRPV
jgi:riboflavin kinase / FMN adenylyltransferase